MPSIFTPIHLDSDLNHLWFSANTSDVTDLDDHLRRFVAAATVQHLSPSIFELCGGAFPILIPDALHEAPLWLMWLGEDGEEDIAELAHTRPKARMQTSTDLMRCREILAWKTHQRSYCASARALRHSLNAACNSDIFVVFVTPKTLVSRPTYVGETLLAELNEMSYCCGVAHFPHLTFTQQERTSARVKSVLLGNEPKVDEEGREIVLLKARQLPYNW